MSRITLGSVAGKTLEVVTAPGEISRRYGDSLRARSNNPNMLILGLTQNTFGYILAGTEFGNGLAECQGGYEETVSLGPLTAPLLDAQAYDVLFAE